MIDSKAKGDEKSINENTINNIKANTQWIEVTIEIIFQKYVKEVNQRLEYNQVDLSKLFSFLNFKEEN